MVHKFIALGLGGAIALLSIGCGSTESADRVASGDSRLPSQAFAAERYPAVLIDKQSQPTAFFVGRSGLGCRDAYYRAVLRSKSNHLPLRVRYEGCAYLGDEVQIETQGCTYTLQAGPPQEQMPVRLSCEEGRKIRIVFPGSCTLEIEPQTPAGGVQLGAEGRGSGRFPVVTFGMTGISVDGLGTAGCPVEEGDEIEVSFRIDLPGYGLRAGEKGKPVGVWIE